MRRLALTSWSLHKSLTIPGPSTGVPVLTLLDMPARLREAGIGSLEICHFHFPETGTGYLKQLRAALDAAGIELFSILIDTGDISNPDPERRAEDMRTIEGWMDVASALGAHAVRVIAGDAPPVDKAALELSITGLRHMAEYGKQRGLRVLTENFRPLASTAANCNYILDALDGAIGLCADIGNFPAEERIAEFTAVVPRAESVHAKASYDPNGTIDADALTLCLDASVAAGFTGPYTLVYDRPGDEWAGITTLKQVVQPYTE